MSNLRTNYKDDVFTGKRKYNQINNGDGTISFDDVTEYAQVGDTYGAAQINETNDVINNLDSKAYKNTDSAENSIADNDYFPFFDASASATKKTLWSNIKTLLGNIFAPKSHASSNTTYGAGSNSLYGHVKLSDNYTSSAGAAASAIGASSKAVYDSYTTNRNSITSLSGTVTANQQTETQHYNSLNNGKAPTNHASSSTTYGKGTESAFGHLKISDNTTSSAGNASDGVAASSAAVVTNRTVETNHYNTLVGYHTEIVGELTANNNRIYMDYQNGKYGYNTSANRGADTFHPFRGEAELIWTNPNPSQSYYTGAPISFDIDKYNVVIVQISDGRYDLGADVQDGNQITHAFIRGLHWNRWYDIAVGDHDKDKRAVLISNGYYEGNYGVQFGHGERNGSQGDEYGIPLRIWAI